MSNASDASDTSPLPAATDPLRGAANLLLLEQLIRRAPTAEELGYTLVNRIRLIAPCDVIALWLDEAALRGGRGRIAAIADLPEPAPDAPLSRFLVRLAGWQADANPSEPRVLSADDAPQDARDAWGEFLPGSLLWVPLSTASGRMIGALMLSRADSWAEAEARVLGRVGEAGAHALERLQLMGRRRLVPDRKARRRIGLGILAAALLAMFVPVQLTVLAPAEIAPRDPLVVRAPLDGVVEAIPVEANSFVEAGTVLARLEDEELSTRLALAEQDLAIAEAEYRQAQQSAMADARAASRLAVLAGGVSQAQAELAHLQELRNRVTLRAERAGLVLIPDRQALLGKPVRLGERLMTVADPAERRILAWLPLPETAEATLFLNVLATRPLAARVERIEASARVAPAGFLAYRVEAAFVDAAASEIGQARIGRRGTLRLEGERVPLALFLFRRPLAALRPRLGL